jgi:hypothetical protein
MRCARDLGMVCKRVPLHSIIVGVITCYETWVLRKLESLDALVCPQASLAMGACASRALASAGSCPGRERANTSKGGTATCWLLVVVSMLCVACRQVSDLVTWHARLEYRAWQRFAS